MLHSDPQKLLKGATEHTRKHRDYKIFPGGACPHSPQHCVALAPTLLRPPPLVKARSATALVAYIHSIEPISYGVKTVHYICNPTRMGHMTICSDYIIFPPAWLEFRRALV